jgi:large subunit ribosomal protein L15
MRLHDLRPAEGSRKERIRVGRGIAAGKGKTAGRGTKGQKARAGGGIPAWFEGGQTPLHMRIPKLRGFKNRFKIEYEIVNVGAINAAVERGAFEAEAADAKPSGKTKAASQITVNQDILRAVGLVRSLNKPLKILGTGDLSAAVFVVADAFSASARSKIEAAGGSVNVLEVPTEPLKAIGVEPGEERTPRVTSRGAQAATAKAADAREARTATADAEAAEIEAAAKAKRPKAKKGDAADASADAETPTASAETAEAEHASASAESAETAEAPSDDAGASTAKAKPSRAARAARSETVADDSDTATADAVATAEPDVQPATGSEPDAESASAATDEAATASGDDA